MGRGVGTLRSERAREAHAAARDFNQAAERERVLRQARRRMRHEAWRKQKAHAVRIETT